jgi:tether containing UBX domain for GLUT4
VYAFVRESLAPSAAGKEFTLYQPPRTLFPENPAPVDPKAKSSAAHPNPAMRSRVVTPAGYNRTAGLQGGTGGAETLTQLGLVPQSMLLIRWEDAAMNGENNKSSEDRADMTASAAVAPITPELAATVALLPTPQVKDSAEDKKSIAKKLTGGAGDVKMPKWVSRPSLF